MNTENPQLTPEENQEGQLEKDRFNEEQDVMFTDKEGNTFPARIKEIREDGKYVLENDEYDVNPVVDGDRLEKAPSSQENFEEKEVLEEGFSDLRKTFGQLAETMRSPSSLSYVEIKLYGAPEALKDEKIESMRDNENRNSEELAEAYRKYDPKFTTYKRNQTESRVRFRIGESYGLNFRSEFMGNPAEAGERSHESWYDAIGTLRFIDTRIDTLQRYSPDSEEEQGVLRELKREFEDEMKEFIPLTNEANPGALAYGIRHSSPDLKEVLWSEIQNKYSENVPVLGLGGLEQVIQSERASEIGMEAWDILKTRSDTPLETLNRLTRWQGGEDRIKTESAQMLLARMEELENEAKNNNESAAKKLEYFYYGSEARPDGYARIKQEIKQAAGV